MNCNICIYFLSREKVHFLHKGDIMATFPERLKELRKKNQLTQQRLADELGVNRVNITRWEKGNIEPNLAQLGNIAIYFNTSIDYLIGKIDKEYEDTSIQELKELSDDEREKFFNNALLSIETTLKVGRLHGIPKSEMLKIFNTDEHKEFFPYLEKLINRVYSNTIIKNSTTKKNLNDFGNKTETNDTK